VVGEFQESLRENPLPAVDIHNALVVGQARRGGGNRALRDALRHGLALEVGKPRTVGTAGAARRGVRRVARKHGHEDRDRENYFAAAHFKYQSKISSPVQYKTPSKRRV